MKSLFKAAILIVAAGFVSVPAFAYHSTTVTTYYPVPQPAFPRNSFYIDVDGGVGVLSTPAKYLCDPVSTACPLDSASYQLDDIAAGANMGYRFALNPGFLLGTELGYDY